MTTNDAMFICVGLVVGMVSSATVIWINNKIYNRRRR